LYPNEYIRYLVHFHGDRDYFECHEILEEYWKLHDCGNKNSIWVALIQLAVSCYHHRRGNFQGAKKNLYKALTIFIKEKKELKMLGLDGTELISAVKERLTLIEQKKPYLSFMIPIDDRSLTALCMEACSSLGLEWGQSSDLANLQIVDRHKLRDRTDIIDARKRALEKKGSENI
jgi:predicted metal-dependent hydrolase